MLKVAVPIFFLLTSFIIFQNCSSQLQSKTVDSDNEIETLVMGDVAGLSTPPSLSDEFNSLLESMNLDSSVSVFKVLVEQDTDSLILEIPNSASGTLDVSNWSLVSDIGDELNLGLSGNPVDLNSLNIDIDLLIDSVLIAKNSSNTDVAYIYLVNPNNFFALNGVSEATVIRD